jgi:hypothetical protein
VAVVIETAVYLAFGCALGTFFSLRSRSSARALLATVATLIVINGAYLIALIPILRYGTDSTFYLLGVTPFVEAVSLMSYGDVERLLSSSSHLRPADPIDVALTCFVSVVVYGAAALILTSVSVALFDYALDRPRTEGPVRRRPLDPDDLVPILEVGDKAGVDPGDEGPYDASVSHPGTEAS